MAHISRRATSPVWWGELQPPPREISTQLQRMSTTLNLTGWEPLSDSTLAMIERHPKLIMVYPHTSRADIAMYILYATAYPTLRRRSRALMDRRHMRPYALYDYFGCIPTTPHVEKGGGATDELVSHLDKMDEFILLISPKGTTNLEGWRSGYYYLAQKLGCPIMCAGPDYYHHRFTVGVPFSTSGMTLQEVNERCKAELASITPMHPKRSEFPIDANLTTRHTTVFPESTMATYVAILVVLLLVAVWALARGRERSERVA